MKICSQWMLFYKNKNKMNRVNKKVHKEKMSSYAADYFITKRIKVYFFTFQFRWKNNVIRVRVTATCLVFGPTKVIENISRAQHRGPSPGYEK